MGKGQSLEIYGLIIRCTCIYHDQVTTTPAHANVPYPKPFSCLINDIATYSLMMVIL